jgi:hypothetical protein
MVRSEAFADLHDVFAWIWCVARKALVTPCAHLSCALSPARTHESYINESCIKDPRVDESASLLNASRNALYSFHQSLLLLSIIHLQILPECQYLGQLLQSFSVKC